jgi:CheY-like chemotaxis protein
VLTAADGLEALALLEGQTVDAILSDVVMPNMGGTELVHAVQRRYPRLPCLLMSGYAASSFGNARVERTPLLRKPFTSQQLRAAVAELLAFAPRDRAAGPSREGVAMPR